jgi:hypothetical protein
LKKTFFERDKFLFLQFLVITGYSFDLTDAIQANEEIATEINGHPIQAKSLDIVTSESSDRNQCQDKASGCPGWAKWACTNNFYKNWMKKTCPKSCGYCTGTYIIEFIFTNPSMMIQISTLLS